MKKIIWMVEYDFCDKHPMWIRFFNNEEDAREFAVTKSDSVVNWVEEINHELL